MILTLFPNVPKFINYFDSVVTIYVKDYGAGNLRLAMDRESLINTIAANNPPGGIVDGIAQAAAAGFVQYFWGPGDLWAISDQADTIVVVAPAYQFLIRRGQPQPQPGLVGELEAYLDPDADLSTYK